MIIKETTKPFDRIFQITLTEHELVLLRLAIYNSLKIKFCNRYELKEIEEMNNEFYAITERKT